MNADELWRYPRPFPPACASAWGDDSYGLWVEIEVGQVIQRLRWIEPGEFWMGATGDEEGRHDDEGPCHRVRLTQGFWLADTACTQALWAAVMRTNPSRFQDDVQNPMVQVSWDDVQGFLGKLNAGLADCRLELPTEAEWEYACRAGTETPFSFGENITPEQVNYDGNYPYAGGKKGLYREKTIPVKALQCNAWGLYQLHGNVWEWCADGKRTYIGEAQTDPRGPEDRHEWRVVRGGSWIDYAVVARSAYRHLGRRSSRNGDLGFRFALRSSEPGLAAGGRGF